MKYQLIKEGLSWIQSQRDREIYYYSYWELLSWCFLIRFLAMSNFDDKKSIDNQYNERQTYYNSLLEKDAKQTAVHS